MFSRTDAEDTIIASGERTPSNRTDCICTPCDIENVLSVEHATNSQSLISTPPENGSPGPKSRRSKFSLEYFRPIKTADHSAEDRRGYTASQYHPPPALQSAHLYPKSAGIDSYVTTASTPGLWLWLKRVESMACRELKSRPRMGIREAAEVWQR